MLYGGPVTRLVPLNDYDFYAADGLVAAISSERQDRPAERKRGTA